MQFSYYIYQNFRYGSGPHSIHGNKPNDTNPLNLQFPTTVKSIDAIMTWHRNKRTYFFAGNYFWRYDSDLKLFHEGYPKLIAASWKGLPKKIDAAFSSDIEKTTYFISGNQLYIMDD